MYGKPNKYSGASCPISPSFIISTAGVVGLAYEALLFVIEVQFFLYR